MMIGLLLLFASPDAEPPIVIDMSAAEEPKYYPETKDRLSPVQLAQMVEGPVVELAKRGLTAAEAKFQRLVDGARDANGRPTLKSADLHSGFGVELYLEATASEDPAVEAASLNHLRLAAGIYEQVLGKQHPEVALALTSLADAMGELDKGRWIAERLPLYRDSLAIRRAVLGAHNPETVANMLDIAEVLAQSPSLDAAMAGEALRLLDEAAANAPTNVPPGHELSKARFDLGRADIFAAQGRGAEALDHGEAAVNALGEDGGPRCLEFVSITQRIEKRFNATEWDGRAAALAKRMSGRCGLSAILEAFSKDED